MPPRPFGSDQPSSLPSLVAIILLALFAGAAGTLIAWSYAPTLVAGVNPGDIGPALMASRNRTSAALPVTALLPAGKASALFAVPKAGTDVLGASYVPGDAVAQGVAITTDGWIATVEPAGSKRRVQDMVVLVGGKAYRVTKTVRDEFSGVTFAKIGAENLQLTAFGDSTGVAAGDTLYTLDASGTIRRVDVLANELAPASSMTEALRSSERAQRMLRIEQDANPGGMLLNDKGQLVGLLATSDAFGTVAVPYEAFSGILGSVLRGQDIQRPYLGVNYAELSLLNARQGETPSRGALLAATADGKAAVLRGSPAAVAGLRAGDIIVALDGEQLTAKNPLAEAVAQYAVGQKVTLTVQRAALPTTFDVEVTLPATPAK